MARREGFSVDSHQRYLAVRLGIGYALLFYHYPFQGPESYCYSVRPEPDSVFSLHSLRAYYDYELNSGAGRLYLRGLNYKTSLLLNILRLECHSIIL